MATTNFTDLVTLSDDGWFNDVDATIYEQHGVGKTTVASATTPNIFAATVGNFIDYTGTVTCTGFVDAVSAGSHRVLYCAGAAVFTAGANLLIDGVASASNLTCVAGDILYVVANTTTQFKITQLTGNMKTSGALLSSSPSAGVGYAAGAGGTVTQITSFTTGVTLNKVCGEIICVNTAFTGPSMWAFVLTNSTISETDTISVSSRHASGSIAHFPIQYDIANGSCKVGIYFPGGSGTAAIVIGFQVHKGVKA